MDEVFRDNSCGAIAMKVSVILPLLAIAAIPHFVCVRACGQSAPRAIDRSPGPSSVVRVAKGEKGFHLLRDGKPFWIQGAGGRDHLDKLKTAGGNSIRTWGADALGPLLDQAHSLGVDRHGRDLAGAGTAGCRLRRPRSVPPGTREDASRGPALPRPPSTAHLGPRQRDRRGRAKSATWKAINEIARMVRLEDPNHPTMAVIAEIGGHKLEHFERYCPEVDILGINSYGGLASLPQRLEASGFRRPYLVAEFGPPGPWEVRRTSWVPPSSRPARRKA